MTPLGFRGMVIAAVLTATTTLLLIWVANMVVGVNIFQHIG